MPPSSVRLDRMTIGVSEPLPPLTQDLAALDVRQPEIEDHQIGRFRFKPRLRLPPARRLDDLITLGAQSGAKQFPDRHLVVDDEDLHRWRSCDVVLPFAGNRHRQDDREDGTGATRRSAGHDRATDRLDETAADHEPNARPAPNVV